MKTDLNSKLRMILWKDLTKLNKMEKFIENTVNLPWLFLSLLLAWYEWYILALPCSFMFFLTSLRQSHNGYHYTLGTSKKITAFTLILNSILMLASMHAIKFNHLRHHKYCLGDNDVEGKCARMPAWKAILFGPIFILETHWTAFRLEKREAKKMILFELALITAFIVVTFYYHIRFLQYHILVMTMGEFLSGFFAVWTVHHDCEGDLFSRTSRGKWANFFTYNMFYHTEHHLFPAVPTIKLPLLANRIDKVLPEYKGKTVF
jgi:fatty acid desaturase